MKNKNKIFGNTAGFTMIEAIAVLAIIGILSGISIASLSSSKNQAKLKNAQTEVAATIKLVQSYALQGKKCGDNSAKSFNFYIVDAEAENRNIYRIRCVDAGDIPRNVGSAYRLSGGVTFSTGSGAISFDLPHARKSGLLNIVFTLIDSGIPDKTIEINDGGLVTIK